MTSIADRGITALRGALQSRPEANGEHFARAVAEHAVITEQYEMTQEVSGNPTRNVAAPSPGRIVVTFPYDGRRHFTQEAVDDVALMGEPLSGDRSVLTGHVVLAPSLYASTSKSLNLSDARTVIPLRVPVSGPSLSGPEALIDDTQACVIEHEYETPPPELVPVSVRMEPEDPDTVEGKLGQHLEVVLKSTELAEEAVELLRSRASFHHYLAFDVEVRLDLPRRTGSAANESVPALQPVLRRVELEWPTLTALDAQALHVQTDPEEQRQVIYDPEHKRLAWTDVRLTQVERAVGTGPDTDTYVSPPMLLLAMSPGQLYKAECVVAHMNIEIPDFLLSGLDARMFSATGQRTRDPRLRTLIRSEVSLYLADRFATRVMSPWQHLYFDEVKPDPDRINDVVTALRDCGYSLDFGPRDLGAKPGAIRQALRASRREGPTKVELVLLIEGEEHETVRTRGVGDAAGGDRFRSTLQTGEMRLFVRGYHPRDSDVVVRDINRLDEEIRQRYAQQRQWR